MGDDRPPVYWENETLVIRASAIGGGCMWELVACGQGYAPTSWPANIRRAFKEGNDLEPVVIQRLKDEHGFEFTSTQIEGELILGDGVIVRYHPDGIADWAPPITNHFMFSWVVECKALHNDVWQKAAKHGVASTFGEYMWQLSVMMHAEKKPGVWVAYNKGLTPDENEERAYCEDQGKLLIEPVLTPIVSLEEIAGKAEKIKELVSGEDILESEATCEDTDHWPCLFLHLRPEKDVAVGIQVLDQDKYEDEDEINYDIREYLTAKGHADESKARYQAARDRLIQRAGDETKIMTSKWVVPIISNSGREMVDWGAMPEGLKEEVRRYMKKGKGYRYISGVKRRD